jgi:hypothetical protein
VQADVEDFSFEQYSTHANACPCRVLNTLAVLRRERLCTGRGRPPEDSRSTRSYSSRRVRRCQPRGSASTRAVQLARPRQVARNSSPAQDVPLLLARNYLLRQQYRITDSGPKRISSTVQIFNHSANPADFR